jgi:peptidyl-prolyl cis-trans isomerase C
MRRIKISLLVLATALLTLTGCNEKPGAKVLAKVNGVPITVDDVNFRQQEGHGKKPEYGPKTVDDIINQELMFQQGVRLGLDQDPSYRRKLDTLNSAEPGAKRLEMARRVFSTEVASKVEVGHQEAKQYFEKNAEQIATDLHLLMVKFTSRGDADQALKKLRSGADFASVARPVMTGAQGGGRQPWDLGFVKWQQVPVEFLDQIYGLKPGQVSEVLGTQRTGYQIVRMVEKRQGPIPEYGAVMALVMNRLRDLKLLNQYHQYLATLRKEAKIVTF